MKLFKMMTYIAYSKAKDVTTLTLTCLKGIV